MRNIRICFNNFRFFNLIIAKFMYLDKESINTSWIIERILMNVCSALAIQKWFETKNLSINFDVAYSNRITQKTQNVMKNCCWFIPWIPFDVKVFSESSRLTQSSSLMCQPQWCMSKWFIILTSCFINSSSNHVFGVNDQQIDLVPFRFSVH